MSYLQPGLQSLVDKGAGCHQVSLAEGDLTPGHQDGRHAPWVIHAPEQGEAFLREGDGCLFVAIGETEFGQHRQGQSQGPGILKRAQERHTCFEQRARPAGVALSSNHHGQPRHRLRLQERASH